MTLDQHVQGLVKACLSNTQHQPHQLLFWLACDILADLGVRHKEPPPADVRPWLRATAAAYARAVTDFPFSDILGLAYQELASHGRRGALGQFFTPAGICELMSSILATGDEHAEARPGGGLWRACEPACGSGALILGLLEQLVQQHGAQALQHWSVTAIDLDPLCAHMCAAQLLANLFVHRRSLGELVVYQGNALGPADGLSVVVHLTVKDLSPHLVLPPLHPSRLAALRDAARSVTPPTVEAPSTTAMPAEPSRGPKSKPLVKPPPGPQAQERQVDLFAD
jgi:hypothetical protein